MPNYFKGGKTSILRQESAVLRAGSALELVMSREESGSLWLTGVARFPLSAWEVRRRASEGTRR